MERTSDVTSHPRPLGVPGVDDDGVGDHDAGDYEELDLLQVAVAEAEVQANFDQRRVVDRITCVRV